MNPDTLPFLLILNAICVAMVAVTWLAHRAWPHRVDRSSAWTRSGLWAILAVTLSAGAAAG